MHQAYLLKGGQLQPMAAKDHDINPNGRSVGRRVGGSRVDAAKVESFRSQKSWSTSQRAVLALKPRPVPKPFIRQSDCRLKENGGAPTRLQLSLAGRLISH